MKKIFQIGLSDHCGRFDVKIGYVTANDEEHAVTLGIEKGVLNPRDGGYNMAREVNLRDLKHKIKVLRIELRACRDVLKAANN
jgi:hypothetical protein